MYRYQMSNADACQNCTAPIPADEDNEYCDTCANMDYRFTADRDLDNDADNEENKPDVDVYDISHLIPLTATLGYAERQAENINKLTQKGIIDCVDVKDGGRWVTK